MACEATYMLTTFITWNAFCMLEASHFIPSNGVDKRVTFNK